MKYEIEYYRKKNSNFQSLIQNIHMYECMDGQIEREIIHYKCDRFITRLKYDDVGCERAVGMYLQQNYRMMTVNQNVLTGPAVPSGRVSGI